jgi:hypothetical protein
MRGLQARQLEILSRRKSDSSSAIQATHRKPENQERVRSSHPVMAEHPKPIR